jgi:hypothetical protein
MTFAELVAQREQNPLWRHFQVYRHNLWSLVCADQERRRRHILIATGRGGIGKSLVFQQVCEQNQIRYSMLSTDINPFRFVRQLYEVRDSPIICLDDAGNMDTSGQIAELVKMGFGPTRTVRHDIQGTPKNPPPPPVFKVKAALVWLTNKDFGDPYNIRRNQRRPFAALLTRATVLDMDEGVTDTDVFRYSILLATTADMFENAKNFISAEAKINAVNWCIENRNALRDPTPRGLDYLGWLFEQERSWRQRGTTNHPDMDHLLRAQLLPTPRTEKIPGFKPLKLTDGRWEETLPPRDPSGRWQRRLAIVR